MAPSFTLDTTFDFNGTFASSTTQPATIRTLLVAPPSISAHPEALDRVFEAHDRNVTDIQMLDRLAMGLVSLPESTYDVILLLTDADGARRESQSFLGRETMTKLVQALRPGGSLRSQDGTFGSAEGAEKTEAILAGLIYQGDAMVKPDQGANQSVKLSFGRKKANAAAVPLNAVEAANTGVLPPSTTGKRKSTSNEPAKPAGVGFVDFSDDLDTPMGEDYDSDAYDSDGNYIPTNEELMMDEPIDENSLLTEADKARRPVIPPAECRPAAKRRRACKDCTCGLKQKFEAEDAAKRAAADQKLSTMKLGADDLAEVDFTVPGK
ncbi:hypothetical protein B0A49_01061, partial [Cryomyces minteri]